MTIQEKYDTFVRENKCAPKYAVASIYWKDSDETVDNMTFSLYLSDSDDVFFSLGGTYELEELTNKSNGEDFYILEETVEFYK